MLDEMADKAGSLTDARFEALQAGWLSRVNDESTQDDPQGVALLVESLASQVRTYGPDSIDLSLVCRRRPSPLHLVAFLRLTHGFRYKISGWSSLCNFAVGYVEGCGFLSAKVMKGLYD